MQFKEMIEFQYKDLDFKEKPWFMGLTKIVGSENIFSSFLDRIAYARDRWPLATLCYRFGKFPFSMPDCIVSPGSINEVVEVVKLANEHGVPITPFGAGSGVLGGALPLKGGVILDLKRLNRVIEIDEISCISRVQSGMNGELFEAALNRKKFTLGHFPQSLHCSTIGGWVATRSAGQASSHYGKIEDMVVSLQVVLPNGDLIETKTTPRSATGPNINHIFIGSEGTLGVITEATFRILPYPERESIHVVGFESIISGLEAIRQIMQAELRPAIVRLYDEVESNELLSQIPAYKSKPCILILTFNGLKEIVEVEERIALRYCRNNGGEDSGPEPAYRWMEGRFQSKAPKQVSQGKLLDTIEVAGKWTILLNLYEEMKKAILKVKQNAHVGAHWSHVYPDGGCMYLTFIFEAPDEANAIKDYFGVWEASMEACLRVGGSISHHHGIGLHKGRWMKDEHGNSFQVLKKLKDVLDPKKIMNPGKLGL